METLAGAADLFALFAEPTRVRLLGSGVDSVLVKEPSRTTALRADVDWYDQEITLADVIRAIDGPLAGVSGQRPETLDFKGTSEPLREVWVAVRASLRGVLEEVTLAHVAGGELPPNVRALTEAPDAWVSH